jgi:hypothetical protein
MRRYTCLTVLFLLFISACSSAPATDDAPPVEETSPPPGDEGPPMLVVDRSEWSERRTALEEGVLDYLGEAPSLNQALHQGSEALDEALEVRMDQQFQIEAELTNYTATNYGDADVEGWASLRLGQMHFEFVCALSAMEPPDGAGDEQVRQFDEAIAMQTRPLLAQVYEYFQHARTNGEEPWGEAAREFIELIGQFEEDGQRVCAEAERYW